MDRISEEKRSEVMRRVKSKNTTPELAVRKLLYQFGFRYRLHRQDLPGVPDITLPRHRIAVFVNGCFWHQHSGCRKATIPENRHDWWERKLRRTVARDAENKRQLEESGWRVIVLWECQIRSPLALRSKIAELIRFDEEKDVEKCGKVRHNTKLCESHPTKSQSCFPGKTLSGSVPIAALLDSRKVP